MVRGIAENVVRDLFGAAALLGLLIVAAWFCFPKARTWAVLGVLCTVGLWVTWQRMPWRAPRSAAEAAGSTPLDRPAVIGGIPIRDSYLLGPDGSLLGGVLDQDFPLDGYPAKAGTKFFRNPYQGLVYWTASREVEIWGAKYPGGTTFDGSIGKDDRIQVFPVEGESFFVARPHREP